MLLNVAYSAIGACLVLAVISSLLASARQRSSGDDQRGVLESFLLAGGSLRRFPIIQLLLSSAFALNGLFYQAWLGYSVGAWGLVTQVAWMIGYWVLAPQTPKIRRAKSLHDLLGTAFGPRTRMVAALCSLVGFVAMMGWEVAICRETFGDILVSGNAVPADQGSAAGAWMAGLTVFLCLIYTVYGGLRGNSVADTFQNIVKLAGFGLVTILLFSWKGAAGHTAADYWRAFLPSMSTMEARLGWFGLATNIVFSLCWQTVDASTWQSILASSRSENSETRSSLVWGGFAALIAPGVLGTALGVALAYSTGITADNVLFKAVEFVGLDRPVVMFIVFFAIACCVMSLLDGLLLASGYAVLIDLVHPNSSIVELDRDPVRASYVLVAIRVFLTALAIFAAWGVHSLLDWWHLRLFDFVYLVIIPQLAIFGPVTMALAGRSSASVSLALVIIVAFFAGVISTVAGQHGVPYVGDGAGTLTAGLSLIGAYALTRARPRSA